MINRRKLLKLLGVSCLPSIMQVYGTENVPKGVINK